MKEITRTLVYVGAAVLFVLGAVGVSYLTAPTSPEAYSKTGEPFFEDFESDIVARLELSAIPEGETQPQTFQLAKRNNVWRLETYRGYPAEAKDRLGKTVASVLGLVREAVVGRSKSEHARYGVLNPDDEELEDHDSAGKRIRMLDSDGNALVDLIIGKPVSDDAAPAETAASSDQNEEHLDKPKPKHYVRRADEEETYIATIDLDISTKFSEWIEPDLLKLKPENVHTLKLDNYEKKEETFMTANGPLTQVTPANREKLTLTRDDQVASWSIPKLDEQTESVQTAKIDELLRVLDEMTILGVAPRYEVNGRSPLTGDLKFQAPPSASDEQARYDVLRRMALDLSKRGFSLPLDQATLEKILRGQGPVPLEMLSQNGDITVATHEGVVYHLHFGKQVVGTEQEIQIGGKPKEDKPAKKKASKKKGSKENSPEKKATGLKKDADETTRRYVLIRVEYDEAFYKDKPKKPEKPVPPSRPVIPAPKPRRVVGPVQAPRPSPRPKGRAPAVAGKPDPVAHFYAVQEEYRDKQRQYENDLRTYESDRKSFRENVKKVKERVERLNGRFDGWYYVISTQNLKQLTLRRGDLVGPKTESKLPTGRPKLPFKLPKR